MLYTDKPYKTLINAYQTLLKHRRNIAFVLLIVVFAICAVAGVTVEFMTSVRGGRFGEVSFDCKKTIE